jgi:xanthine dehydrogenase accessory factor
MDFVDHQTLEQAIAWRRQSRPVVLATVVTTWGSAPRSIGSFMVVTEGPEFAGSVSGGCVEADVVAAAEPILAGGAARLLEYGVTDGKAWEVGLACGGRMEVQLTALNAVFDALVEAYRAQRGPILITDLGDGRQALVDGDRVTGDRRVAELATQSGNLPAHSDRGRKIEAGRRTLFVQVFAPPLNLVLTGAGHIAQALSPMARIAGYRVVIVDPRSGFANPVRFPDTEIRNVWIGEQDDLGLNARSAVLALAHDPQLDDPLLMAALRSESFYIGALGGRASTEQRRRRLADLGFSDGELARIHGPVGLDIGADSPAEIAISIIAEMTAALRGKL